MKKTVVIKDIVGISDTQKRLLEGLNKLADAVGATMGAAGNNVLIEGNVNTPSFLTKDGISVAKSIKLEDAIQDVAADLAVDAAETVLKTTGDATSLTTILIRAIYKNSLDLLEDGKITRTNLIKEILDFSKEIIQTLKKNSNKIKTKEDILNIANISSNNDKEVVNLIGQAHDKIDLESGLIEIKESQTSNTYIDIVEGVRIHSGFGSHHFITNSEDMAVEYDSPIIVISEEKISDPLQIVPVLKLLEKINKPLILIAPKFEGNVMGMLVYNKVQQGLRVAAIEMQGTNKFKEELFNDLSVITGATLISENLGTKFEDFENETATFGSCDNIIITSESTTIYGGRGSVSNIENRKNDIKNVIKMSTEEFDRNEQKLRLSSRFEGIATIFLYAKTLTELRARMDLLDDATKAVRAAYVLGYSSGGGAELRDIASSYEDVNNGEYVLTNSLIEPFLQILANADISAVDNDFKEGEGINVLTGNIVNMIEEGVIDPTLSLVTAIESAVSISNSLLSVSHTIIDKRYS